MVKTYRSIKRFLIPAWNLLVFLSVIIPSGRPLNQWPRAWRHIQEKHRQETSKLLTELTMEGRVKRRIDEKGGFRYYPMDSEGSEGANG